MLAAIYYAMLLTNWGAPTTGDSTAVYFDGSSNASYWIMFVASWVALFVYIFSLLAPLIFRGRDFG
jgi:hypothetical protein